MQDALNYNEQKVKKCVADCLCASGYLHKPEALNFYKKLEGLEQRNSLNERATTKTLHVSLNFSSQDRKLDTPTLISIAKDYMKGIGFDDQPYLVYCHRDAGHPHLHIVSTTIRPDGSRIPTHNLGKDQSSKVRIELEKKYNLTTAKGRTIPMASELHSMPHPAQYGKEETRNAIARVVSHVFLHYAYSSFPEYNAALRSFGVVADRGSEGSRTYQHGGLVYRILNERGEKVGVPIKASLLPGRLTLRALEQHVTGAAQKKAGSKSVLTAKLDAAIKSGNSIPQFISLLKSQGIFALPRQNKGGPIYGITYVDHQTGCVFNGSDLGKAYSAAGILAKLPLENANIELLHHSPAPSHHGVLKEKQETLPSQNPQGKIIEQMLSAQPHPNEVSPPTELTKKRKRKQKRAINS